MYFGAIYNICSNSPLAELVFIADMFGLFLFQV